MRVDLAAETLSSTVAKAIRHFLNDDAEETAVFIERFNKFFDILNVKNYTECYLKRKYNKTPYRWDKDIRLEWLETVFLPWLDEWEQEAKTLSFIELIRYIFTIPGVKSFLSENISQDPLEKFFGRQRQRGGVNENPTTKQFLVNNQALRVVNSIKIDTSKGNTRGSNQDTVIIDDGPLQKRRRCSKPIANTPLLSPDDSQNDMINLTSIVADALASNIFQVPTKEATTAMQSARALHEWLSDNEGIALQCNDIFRQFYNLWTSLPPRNHSIREQIWQRFTSFISSSEYTLIWQSLYSLASVKKSSVLSLYLTYFFFVKFWKNKYSIADNATEEQQVTAITEDEKCALWYIAGYLIRKVKGKVGMLLAEKMEMFLEEVDDVIEDDTTLEEDIQHPKKWLESINRGGLVKCSNDFYEHLQTVEKEIRQLILPSSKCVPLLETTTDLLKSRNIEESWSSVSQGLDIGDSAKIHSLVIEEFLKVRCFGHTKIFLELYKNTKKKNLQKSRGFRTTLLATSTTSTSESSL
uniref:Uncharacterized protein n=1 Tax=Amphimedon queenslandica TaxID=400682 RepID=A0A1X7STK4_AMPQE